MRKAQSQNDFVYAADVMTGNFAAPNWTDAAAAPCGHATAFRILYDGASRRSGTDLIKSCAQIQNRVYSTVNWHFITTRARKKSHIRDIAAYKN
ncbi:MAG: hypothetical protein ACREOO_23135 [bacterium]